MARTFELKPAVREGSRLWLGLAGPSGGGKTWSALRLATGMQRVFGGDIAFIDTEGGRALHYADRFEFKHMAFDAPFSPLDYLAAIEAAVSSGSRIIVIDSCSHEHEGPGGVLEWHDEELEKMGGRSSDSFRAWAEPKKARRRLINAMTQMKANFILCFRAEDKVKPEKGSKNLQQLGWMPIAPMKWVFECTAMALLPPGAKGVPVWNPEGLGERQFVKMPEQFTSIFAERQQLSEDIGEQLARWAAGDTVVSKADEFVAELDKCLTVAEFEVLKSDAKRVWKQFTKVQADLVSAAVARCKTRLEEGAKA